MKVLLDIREIIRIYTENSELINDLGENYEENIQSNKIIYLEIPSLKLIISDQENLVFPFVKILAFYQIRFESISNKINFYEFLDNRLRSFTLAHIESATWNNEDLVFNAKRYSMKKKK